MFYSVKVKTGYYFKRLKAHLTKKCGSAGLLEVVRFRRVASLLVLRDRLCKYVLSFQTVKLDT